MNLSWHVRLELWWYGSTPSDRFADSKRVVHRKIIKLTGLQVYTKAFIYFSVSQNGITQWKKMKKRTKEAIILNVLKWFWLKYSWSSFSGDEKLFLVCYLYIQVVHLLYNSNVCFRICIYTSVSIWQKRWKSQNNSNVYFHTRHC